jgi:four helix bundle protein
VNARRFEDLRAWQAARTFKLSVYRLIEAPALAQDERLATQLREASRSAVSHISEGFGRFDPLDFARFVKMAKASLIECKNHLVDAVDQGHISEQTRINQAAIADTALSEIGGLLDYLQSPEPRGTPKGSGGLAWNAERDDRVQHPGTPNPEL